VIDASAATEYLLRTPIGRRLEEIVEDAFLIAPAFLDVEVLSVLRRAVLHNGLAEDRAWSALEDLRDWPLDRIPHTVLVEEAWRHRHNVSAYDAFYVAVARLYDAPSSPRTAHCPVRRSVVSKSTICGWNNPGSRMAALNPARQKVRSKGLKDRSWFSELSDTKSKRQRK